MGRRKCRIRKQWVQKKAPAPAASPSPPPPPPWIELPGDVTANILQRLGAEAMLRSAQQVCRTWWKVCKDPAMWRVIDLCNIDDMNMFEDYNAMCRRAVDRSQGQLVDLTIDFFGDGELIIYVADRSRNLKRLKLVSCDEMSADPLIQAVEKLEQLEELHLIMFPWIEAHHIEAIGHSCPKLKSFSYNERGSKIRLMPDSEEDDYYSEGFDRNTYARAIGKCMPNLHHLQLFAHEEMQNEGLEAILDGCPRLESLDIRQCYGLDLGGDLGKRCREQIKDLRLPNDSVSDVPWLVGEPSELDFERYSDCYDDNSYYGDFEYEYYDDYFSPLGYGSFNDDFSPRGYGFFNDDGPGIFDYDFF
ncbi:putative F-box/LRR-repeat protein 23 [Salvia miltiorrhiza]|uniref:putative F-box/LRR-repeat protein 23 n=1 Tax=Salvia miltiorrhiza TaxID=226208 RepID=UPI0025AB8D96|nr:putative F-box/LRR-repeat protein 23 [Salvia miltiorrhiza]XP_057763931.1 putative F-box/LRR-repeat protein 23 [Salvia miltiorrhiza]